MTRSQDRYDAFAKAVDVPMLVITLLWLPVLIVPLVVPLHELDGPHICDHRLHPSGRSSRWSTSSSFHSPQRRGYFVKTHLLDLLIVRGPVIPTAENGATRAAPTFDPRCGGRRGSVASG